MKSFVSTIAVTAVLWATSSACDATMLLDWTQWNSTFVGGNTSGQTLAVSGTQSVTYSATSTGGTIFLFGTPDVLIDSPPSFPFNGTGGTADHYLDIYQDQNFPGQGSVHTFSFATPVDNLSMTFWDIDASNAGGDNYVDELNITATLLGGSIVDPTGGVIADTNFVQQVDSNTWSGIPFNSANDNSTEGNLDVYFQYNSIVSIQIEFLNSTNGPTAGVVSGDHAIGIFDLQENNPLFPVPEPSGFALATLASLGLLRRRHSQAA
ncbi:MAG: PEP-CTERM sorting domain-containing protein [Planctomycetales bacterium]|nr:PEP-CTERM sorting domain-containing protein [Planctomycetales bacterium]